MGPWRTEVTADFQRLNVLLLRAVTGKMIGTALLTEARVHVKLTEAIGVSGSLGGLQVNSLLPGSQLHQRIISVGRDPAAEDSKSGQSSSIHTDLYNESKQRGQTSDRDVQAFSFRVDCRASGR